MKIKKLFTYKRSLNEKKEEILLYLLSNGTLPHAAKGPEHLRAVAKNYLLESGFSFDPKFKKTVILLKQTTNKNTFKAKEICDWVKKNKKFPSTSSLQIHEARLRESFGKLKQRHGSKPFMKELLFLHKKYTKKGRPNGG